MEISYESENVFGIIEENGVEPPNKLSRFWHITEYNLVNHVVIYPTFELSVGSLNYDLVQHCT